MNPSMRQRWERLFEGLRGSARGAILIGVLIWGIGALGAQPPAASRPLSLGLLRPAFDLWSQVFFGVIGPVLLLYGLAVAAVLLFAGRTVGERVSAPAAPEVAEDWEERKAA
jgi:hypothetical protein